MARTEDIPNPTRDHILALEMPKLPGAPWVTGGPLSQRKVAIITSAALHHRDQPPFKAGSTEYRELPSNLPASEIRMSHISINYDRAGWQRDINTVYPIDRLNEMARDGVIGSVASTHYSVMGSTDPVGMQDTVAALAAKFTSEGVDAVLLCPV